MACEELLKVLERIIILATPEPAWAGVSDGAFLRRSRVVALDAIANHRCPDPDAIPAGDAPEAVEPLDIEPRY